MHVYPTAQVPKETHIIESAPHLMPSQLDTVAGDLLKRQASNGVDNLCKVFPAAIILYLLLYSFIMTTYSFTNIYIYVYIYIYMGVLGNIYILYTIYYIYIYIDISSSLPSGGVAGLCGAREGWDLRDLLGRDRGAGAPLGGFPRWGKRTGNPTCFWEKNGKIWRCWDEKRVSQIWRWQTP